MNQLNQNADRQFKNADAEMGGKLLIYNIQIMKQKMQSLKDFESKGLNKITMGKIFGGYAAPSTTAGGTTCVPTSVTSTGCLAYTSDTIDGTLTTFNSPSEFNVPC